MPTLKISTENAEYQIIQALKLNRTKRHQLKEVFIEGIESIKQAVSAESEITRIITVDIDKLSSWSKDLIRKNQKTKVIEMSLDLYKSLCDKEEPSEILVTVKVEFITLNELKLSSNPFLLIFDRPSDFGNLGSIIRSANAFGVDAVFIMGHSVDIYDPKVIRSSLGSVFHSKIVLIQSIQDFEHWITTQKQKSHLRIVGSDSSGNTSLLTHPLTRPIAIVLGNEAKGMSLALKSLCDDMVSIPLSGVVNSLNVANAGSILLWDVYKNSH